MTIKQHNHKVERDCYTLLQLSFLSNLLCHPCPPAPPGPSIHEPTPPPLVPTLCLLVLYPNLGRWKSFVWHPKVVPSKYWVESFHAAYQPLPCVPTLVQITLVGQIKKEQVDSPTTSTLVSTLPKCNAHISSSSSQACSRHAGSCHLVWWPGDTARQTPAIRTSSQHYIYIGVSVAVCVSAQAFLERTRETPW